jgi:cytochrome c-type biogenesis protein CcmH
MVNQEDYQTKRLFYYSVFFAGMIVLLTFLLMVRPASAQEESPRTVTDDEVNAVAKELYCPVCENIPLDVCPTKACAEWREDVRDKLEQGWSEVEIKQYFITRYGDRVVATPPARGLNWLVYLLPPLVIALGAIFLVIVMLGMKKRSTFRSVAGNPSTASDSQPGDAYLKRVEEELKRR